MSNREQTLIFQRNLLNYLEASGKTQKEVSDAIGVSHQTFNTWCRGIAIPRMGKIQALADYFHINKSDLIEKHGESNAEMDARTKRFVSLFQNVSPDVQQAVETLLKSAQQDS